MIFTSLDYTLGTPQGSNRLTSAMCGSHVRKDTAQQPHAHYGPKYVRQWWGNTEVSSCTLWPQVRQAMVGQRRGLLKKACSIVGQVHWVKLQCSFLHPNGLKNSVMVLGCIHDMTVHNVTQWCVV